MDKMQINVQRSPRYLLDLLQRSAEGAVLMKSGQEC